MSRRAVIAVAVAALGVTWGSAASDGRQRGCPPAGAEVADQEAGVTVFWRHAQLLACRSGRRTNITSLQDGTEVNEPPAIDLSADGRVVGYAASILDAPGSDFVVSVERLGRDVDRVAYRSGGRGDGVASLQVLSDGSVAWIECSVLDAGLGGRVECGNSTRTVFRHRGKDGPTAKPEVLARSPRIALKSLRLHGSVVSWRQAGRRRSASLR